MHVAIENLTKRFGRQPALHEISLTLVPGEIVVLLGPNGAGKTTLLNCLAGVTRREQGRILFDGELFERDRVDHRQRLFFLPDLAAAVPSWSVLRHLGSLLHLYETPTSGIEAKVVEVLRELDLLEVAEWRLGMLSRGQVHKTLLAALLLVDPELWLLDEPFASGMDPAGLNALKRHARAAVARGRIVVYSTQILEVAERFADRLCVLHHGQLKFLGPLAQVPRGGDASALETLFQSLRESTNS